MKKIAIPDDLGEIVAARLEKEEKDRRASEERARERATMERKRQVRLDLACERAQVIFDWARELGTTGVLDGLEAGILLYKRQGYMRILTLDVRRGGSLYFRSKYMPGPDRLAEVMNSRHIDELAELIENGGIWDRIRELNLPSADG